MAMTMTLYLSGQGKRKFREKKITLIIVYFALIFSP